jgi:hypothetical protein
VPEEGVEPSRPEGHGILSPARLPVSPLRPGSEKRFKYTAGIILTVVVWSRVARLELKDLCLAPRFLPTSS